MTFEELANESLANAFDSIVDAGRDADGSSVQDQLRCAAVVGYAGDHVRGMLGTSSARGRRAVSTSRSPRRW